jgi:hypothetical protein
MRTPLIAALAGAAVLLPAAPSSAASCGRVDGGFVNTIVGFNVSCTRAKALAHTWHRRSIGNPGSKTVGTYHCQSTATDPEHVAVICTRIGATSHKVFFFAGP